MPISAQQYQKDFGIVDPARSSSVVSGDRSNRRTEAALQHALDIRKFEIDLYWRRATYFWAFIAAAFAAYAAVQSAQSLTPEKIDEFSLLIASVGLVFSWGWFCANRGSKHWQENWENHVDLLEDEVNGPLYKTILEPAAKSMVRGFIWGPKNFSVSKINQVISLFIAIMWLPLIFEIRPPLRLATGLADLDLFKTAIVGFTIVALVLITCSKTDSVENEKILMLIGADPPSKNYKRNSHFIV